jgi:SAM-dependent methyltransferase
MNRIRREGEDTMSRDKNKTNEKNLSFDFQEVFDPDNYLYFYERSLSQEATAKEVNFLVEKLHLNPSTRILDLACGQGRHANRLAGLGFSVVGIDINENLLALAENDAASRGLNVQYIKKDMRDIRYTNEYDRIYLLYTSFGYFDDNDNRKVLKNVARALKPKGLFCFDLHNRDMFLKYYQPHTVVSKENDLMISMNSFDVMTGRWNCRRIIIKDEKRREVHFSVRLYNFSEIRNLLENVGLTIKNIYGSRNGDPFVSSSHQMVIIAEKEK